ncbi:hypothetical protein PV08_06115 [Exophiala spinifera]|uniref:Uncharacterized protein n=1 Tax=Exophiala spinifera TaxID=91928 RepID=A0A0D2BXS6_9EURO|nr:uncharacterized protein PV08_06115 [Exophiala spinifera]KIW16064.1 hypothetical protein PV08_06115 [Exophiala spinifera]
MATETPNVVGASVLTSGEINVPTAEKPLQNGPILEKVQQANTDQIRKVQVKESGSNFNRLRTHLSSPIRVDIFAEIELLIVSFCTGIQDVTTFPDYHCFASNQTGMLALSSSSP